MNIAAAAKVALHRLGALAAYHRWRNRRTLTVVGFHRVLPAAELDRSQADPTWTVTTELFEEVLNFLRRHYNLVGLDDVLAARAHRMPLPPRALLVTFDDGWRDNLDYALPILKRCGVPAVLFVASGPIESAGICWWQEVLLWALRSGRKSSGELLRDASPSAVSKPAGEVGELDLLLRYASLDPVRRDELLRPLARELEAQQRCRHMLDGASLRELAGAGMALGVHGAAHLPLTEVADPQDEIRTSRLRLAALSGTRDATTLSFPHGRYDARVVDTARRLGFELMFTSDAVLNTCPGQALESDLVGRIAVIAQQVTRPDARLAGERLATWLFLRPRRSLACTSTAAMVGTK